MKKETLVSRVRLFRRTLSVARVTSTPLLCAILSLSSAGLAVATPPFKSEGGASAAGRDEIDVNQIRQELAELKAQEAQAPSGSLPLRAAQKGPDGRKGQSIIPADPDGFVLVDTDLDKANKDLRSQEQVLVDQLKNLQGENAVAPKAAAVGAAKKDLHVNLDTTDAKISELSSSISAQMAKLEAQKSEGEGQAIQPKVTARSAEPAPHSDEPKASLRKAALSDQRADQRTDQRNEAESSLIEELSSPPPAGPARIVKVNEKSAGLRRGEIAGAESAQMTIERAAQALEREKAQTTKALSALRQENAALRGRLADVDSRAGSLEKELSEARNRLMMAETEVERLSSVLESRNQAQIASFGRGGSAPLAVKPVSAPAGALVTRRSEAESRTPSSDMLIATVIVDKAYLRTGPSKDNSPLLAVPKGSKLTVETRQGEWYRVMAPTGVRAWVSSDVVAFGKDGMSGPTRTVRVRGYDASGDGDSFQFTPTKGH